MAQELLCVPRPAWLDQIDSLDQATFRRNLRLVLQQQTQQAQQAHRTMSARALDAEEREHKLEQQLDAFVAAGSMRVGCVRWAALVERAKATVSSVGGAEGAADPMPIDALYIDCEGRDAAVVREVLAYADASHADASHAGAQTAPDDAVDNPTPALHTFLPGIICFEHAHLHSRGMGENDEEALSRVKEGGGEREEESEEEALWRELHGAGYVCGHRGAEDTCCVNAHLLAQLVL
jgi:hypothetical protein